MDSQIVQDASPAESKPFCAHQRLIDNIRTRSGRLTGKVRCLECGTVFDDPTRRMT